MEDGSPDGTLPPDCVERQVSFLAEVHGRLDRSRVLDLACGAGIHAELFLELGATLVGVDQNYKAVARAQRRTGGVSAKFVHADLRSDWHSDLARDQPFTLAVMMYGTWSTLPPRDRLEVLKNVADLLGPGGFFVFDGIWGDLPISGSEPTLLSRERYWNIPGGFWGWVPRPIVDEEWHYPGENLVLERNLVGKLEFGTWKQSLDPREVSRAASAAGFGPAGCWEGSFGVLLAPELGRNEAVPGKFPRIVDEPKVWEPGASWWTLALRKTP